MTKVYDNATDLITFARGSSATYLDSDGVIKTAATDAPRIEYAEDGTLKGLLIEEQRTNLVTNSDTSDVTYYPHNGQEAPATLSNGVSGQSLTVPSDGFADFNQIIAVSASTAYTLSFYATSSGVSIRPAVQDVSNTAWIVSPGQFYELSSQPTRIEISFTTPAGCTQIGVRFHYGNLSTGDTVAFGGFQLEEGSFPTSYIPTSGSQKTRDPDIASIPVSAFGYNDQAGTVVVEYSTFHTYTGSPYPRVVNLSQVGAASRTGVEILGYLNNTTFEVYNLGANQSSAGSGTGGGGTVAIAFAQDNIQAAKDGSLVGATDTSATIVPYTDMFIGMSNAFGSNHISGHIKSLKYFPRRLTDAQLQELTA